MPELPDVEVFKKYLDSTALHSGIDSIEFPEKMEMFEATANQLKEALEGHQLKSSKRIGKYLFVEISSGQWLLLHFGMTGFLEYYKNLEMPDYTKLLINFRNGYHLACISRRKLGRIALVDDPGAYAEDEGLGKDALEMERKEFIEMVQGRSGSIKGVLMDQKSIAGIGNVYSDEILYQCEIHPESNAKKLDEGQVGKLYNKMQHVLKMVIDKGADPKELPDTYLLTHREKGTECPRCKGKIKQIRVSGRSTYFCPSCQEKL